MSELFLIETHKKELFMRLLTYFTEIEVKEDLGFYEISFVCRKLDTKENNETALKHFEDANQLYKLKRQSNLPKRLAVALILRIARKLTNKENISKKTIRYKHGEKYSTSGYYKIKIF